MTIDDPDPANAEDDASAVFRQGRKKGGAKFLGGEGATFRDGAVVFGSSDGGDKGLGQVFQYTPTTNAGKKNEEGELVLLYESTKRQDLDGPDNMTTSPGGAIVIAEDGNLDNNCVRALLPDGSLITYTAPKAGAGQQELVLLRKPPGSAEPAETLLANPSLAYTGVWLRDGSAMLTTGLNLRRTSPSDSQQAETRSDLAINLNGGRGPLQPILASSFSEQYISASPDGKWIAYCSGAREVYMQRFPNDGTPKTQLSENGGCVPRWANGGREIVYSNGRRLMVARLAYDGRSWRVESRQQWTPRLLADFGPLPNFDVAGGERVAAAGEGIRHQTGRPRRGGFGRTLGL